MNSRALSLAFRRVLLILIFPRFNFTWLAPVALAPLLVACAREASWKRRFLEGWAAGFVFWFGVCYWIQFVLEVHGGMGRWGGWGTFVLFAILKGLHMAVFAALAGFLMPKLVGDPRRRRAVDRDRAHARTARLRLARSGKRRDRYAGGDAPGALSSESTDCRSCSRCSAARSLW